MKKKSPMKFKADPAPALQPGQIVFYDNSIPGLEAGDYVINIAQRIHPTSSVVIDESYVASQGFSVTAPRYTLPPEDIFSVFPPEDAQGIFDQFLPHVVLTKRDLPWERDVFKTDGPSQVPWLAVLLFVEGEANGLLAPNVPNWTPNRTMAALITADQLFPATPSDSILLPTLDREWYETDDVLKSTQCAIIDIDPKAFTQLLPTTNDLRYLAHVRQVDPSAKDSQVLKINGSGFYSVVVGNRLADPPAAGGAGKRNIVHLVSLDGFNDVIQSGNIPAGTTAVRMISLKSWCFQCLPEMGESFAQLMQGLVTDSSGAAKSTSFQLPLPAASSSNSPQASYVYQSVQSGYVPLRYQTRLGEETVAWYRGPFSPVPVADFITSQQQVPNNPDGWQTYDSASEAMIYDKDRGVFDASYGVAWETGRLLALSDGHFGQQLLNWQRQGHALIDTILERQSQFAALSGFNFETNPADEDALLAQIGNYAVTDPFMSYLITQLATQLAPATPNTPQPPAPPFPPFAVSPPVVPSPQTIADLMTQSAVQDAIRSAGGQQLETVADWLAERYVLIGVPFESLVPQQSLLPKESVRFFYLDPNWLATLLEGALSIGIESSRDRLYQDMMKDLIWNAVFQSVQTLRDNLLGSLANVTPTGSKVPFDHEALCGMLLRSAAVSGWPGMEINAFAGLLPNSSQPDLNTFFPPLRVEKLADDILLVLWPTTPAAVSIEEPHEGIAFGFEDVTGGTGLGLRSLAANSYGTLTTTTLPLGNMVDPVTRHVNIAGAGGLCSAIATALSVPTPLAVRDFAIQMVKVPEQALFTPPSSGSRS
jgi:hypothetical protein